MLNTQYISNSNNIKLAYMYQKPQKGKEEFPEIVFLSGFRSDMRGVKATVLADFAERQGYGFLRLDYSGHGRSEGDFKELAISDWVSDAKLILEHAIPKDKPLIVIGSSMGGWIALKLLTEMQNRKTSFIGIAPAADFTEKLMPMHAIMQPIKKCLNAKAMSKWPVIMTLQLPLLLLQRNFSMMVTPTAL